MCEFISWKEVATQDGTEILFLTYDQIYNSQQGKKLQRFAQPEDFIGHGAIDFYYALAGKGKNFECTDFSSPENFPLIISETIKKGRFYSLGTPGALLSQSARAEYERIGKSARAEYERIEQSAWAEYERIGKSAWAEHERIEQSAWAEHERIEQSAWAEYERIEQSARAEYERIGKSAWAEYERIKQKFWELFSIPENRAEVWR